MESTSRFDESSGRGTACENDDYHVVEDGQSDHDHPEAILTPATTNMIDARGVPEIYSEPSTPCPGKTFIIRDTDSGHLLSLFDGNICLLPVETTGSAFYWSCEETEGWLGFKNLASGEYLSYHTGEYIISVPHHQGLEYFCLRMVRNGGYVMLLQKFHGKALWAVKVKDDEGLQQLVKVEAPRDQGLSWEFIEIQV